MLVGDGGITAYRVIRLLTAGHFLLAYRAFLIAFRQLLDALT